MKHFPFSSLVVSKLLKAVAIIFILKLKFYKVGLFQLESFHTFYHFSEKDYMSGLVIL